MELGNVPAKMLKDLSNEVAVEGVKEKGPSIPVQIPAADQSSRLEQSRDWSLCHKA